MEEGVFQRLGLITLNRPDLRIPNVKVRYLYCLDNSIVSLWDILSIALA